MSQLQIISSAQAGSIHGVKALVYGRPNAGKTVLCASAPRPIIFSAERGLLSLRRYNLPVVMIENLKQLTDVHNWCLGSNEARQFETFCLDSVSEIAEVILESERTKVKDGRIFWQATYAEVMRMLRNFRDYSHRHVYFIAKEEFDKDATDGRMLYRPMMPGRALVQNIGYMFDEVFRLVVGMQQGQEVRALQTRPDFQTEAKDRSGMLAPWEPPDLSYVFNKILQG